MTVSMRPRADVRASMRAALEVARESATGPYRASLDEAAQSFDDEDGDRLVLSRRAFAALTIATKKGNEQ